MRDVVSVTKITYFVPNCCKVLKLIGLAIISAKMGSYFYCFDKNRTRTVPVAVLGLMRAKNLSFKIATGLMMIYNEIFKMKYFLICCIAGCFLSCQSSKKIQLKVPAFKSENKDGEAFFKSVISFNWKQRDSAAVREILSGNIPSFLKQFVPVYSSVSDSNGKHHTAIIYVGADYLSVGNDDDFARVPLTPLAAQKIADSLNCFLPTKKIVDLIYEQATIKPEPVPMYIFRDSSVTMWQHHLIIEGQRKQQKGLIAGIKKDVVISAKILSDPKPNRVAIYGWHQLNGKPIQPLYTGHVNWYADYSHGIRLVYRKIKVDGKWMDYEAVLKDPVLQKLICDEAACNFYRYAY